MQNQNSTIGEATDEKVPSQCVNTEIVESVKSGPVSMQTTAVEGVSNKNVRQSSQESDRTQQTIKTNKVKTQPIFIQRSTEAYRGQYTDVTRKGKGKALLINQSQGTTES